MSYLEHYGTPRHSGRYPWGSGKNPQRNRSFLQRADDLAKQGLTKKEIADAFNMSTGDYVAMRKIYKNQVDAENQLKAMKLHNKQWSNTAIAKELGVSEGTVRNMLNPNRKQREDNVKYIADNLKEVLKTKPYLDIGEGVNRQLNISEEQLHAAELLLKDEGYSVHNYRLPQVNNPKQFTNLKVLCEKNVDRKDLSEHLGEVTSPDGLYFKDYGTEAVFKKPVPSIKANRIKVKYDEEGGGEKDGVIELRPGVEDLSLDGRRYAQVRIGVNGTHYLKGMAVYGDPKKMPEGVDIVFNTSKHKGTPVLGKGDETVLKEMKNDPSNPFGATFRQLDYKDAKGNKHTSPVNIVNDDTDWDKWKKNLSSQFLSKQLPSLAKRQLDIRYSEMNDEFSELKSITNPTLKRQLLEEFADTCDSAAVHLKAAALPRQGSFAILPVNSLKDNEVYAPMYDQGEEVILVRHPHEGVFQIPRLIVNNNNREGKQILGTSPAHAIGINSKTANQLSGADYDGDTVLVIPTKGQRLKNAPPLEGLKDFNPSNVYSRDHDDPIRTGKSKDGKKGDGFNKGLEMGKASNLITDMTIQGATLDEIERAVKYSMTVIDAEKHNLDWKRSYNENGIAELKDRYQLRYDDEGNAHRGAATLISRAKSPTRINERKEIYGTSRMTPEELERYKNGEVIYRETGRTHKDPKTGKIKVSTEEHEKMAIAKDARELSSGYYIEEVYAAHANRMKALANEARKESRTTGRLEQNKQARETFKDVVGPNGTLAKKIMLAELAAPKERQAQILANSAMKIKEEQNPKLKEKENRDKRKKLAAKALDEARDAVNGGIHVKRYQIILTDREWDAIQAGAISDTQFQKVLRYSDTSEIKKRALPRQTTGMKASTKSRARLLLNAGYAPSTVAADLGVSVETLRKEFNNFNGMEVG